MSAPSRPQTVTAASALLENYLIQVPKAGESVCITCHSSVYGGFSECYPCSEARSTLKELRLDCAASIAVAPSTEQMARDLRTYKSPEIPQHLRTSRSVGLAATLWRWLRSHEKCLLEACGIDKFDLVTTVPSTSGRTGEHPLKKIVGGIVSGTSERLQDVLVLNNQSIPVRRAASDRFRAVRSLKGKSVLVIDDTWTTGAKIQSAGAALKLGGAATVAGLTIGRWFTTDYKENDSWLRHVKKTQWSWDDCCLESP